MHDVETYKKYALQVARTVEPFGGRLVVAADTADLLEGDQPYPRTVVGEFADTATARAWYESVEYQQIQPLRAAAASGAIYIVEGFSLPSAPQASATSHQTPGTSNQQ